MIPANVNPLMMAGNADPLDEYRVITNSVRFNITDAAYLTRTPASSGNRKTWTWSGWVKRSVLGGEQDFWNCTNATGTVRGFFRFNAANNLYLGLDAATASLITTAVYRDLSAHMHVHLLVDTTQAVAADRFKLWINGVQVTAGTFNYPVLNADTEYNIGTQAHTLSGSQPYVAEYFGGYISEVYFVDGQALAPTLFGGFHPRTNQWRPKLYTGSYGTNGFHLDFSDGSAATAAALGKDRSGNNNDWTPTNVSVASGAGNDWLTDTPTNNYCMLNPIKANVGTTTTYTDGALQVSFATAATTPMAVATQGMIPGEKMYAEVTCIAVPATAGDPGVQIGILPVGSYNSIAQVGNSGGYHYGSYTGEKNFNGTVTAYGATYTVGDVIGIKYDPAAQTLEFLKNNISQGIAFTGIPAGVYFFAVSGFNPSTMVLNFGQRAFSYTPPAGFKALCTKNLPQQGTVTVSGTFTGNANADGPFVPMNGTPTTLTINGNAVTFGTHADALANGFKLRTASASYNTAGSNTWTATIVSSIKNIFRHQNARGN